MPHPIFPNQRPYRGKTVFERLLPIDYHADDLASLSWNGAILIEPDPLAVETALEPIEFANVELLMSRSYDEALDEELPRLYARLPKDPRRFAIPSVRRYIHEVQRMIVEFTGVTEKAGRFPIPSLSIENISRASLLS